MELLSKIAAVFVTVLLYFVLAILQTPRTARAAEGCTSPVMAPTTLSAAMLSRSGDPAFGG